MKWPRRTITAAANGLLIGGSLGALTGFLDCLRTIIVTGIGFSENQFVPLVLWYIGIWAAGGVLLGLGGSFFASCQSNCVAFILAIGSVLFLAVMAVNVLWEKDVSAPACIAADTSLLLVGILVLVRFHRRKVRFPRRGLLVLSGLCMLLLAGWVSWNHLAADESPSSQASRQENRPRALETETKSEVPSVLLLVADSLRADHTSLHGYYRNTTPNLDILAQEAAVFERARAPSSWTKPSVATMLTGLPPGAHRAEGDWERLPDEAMTIAELFSSAGYATALFSDNQFVSRYFGLDQGFELTVDRTPGSTAFWLDRSGIPRGSLLERFLGELIDKLFPLAFYDDSYQARGAPALIADFLDWTDGIEPGRPWFAYLHFMETHVPYQPPPPWDRMFTETPRRRAEHGFHGFQTGWAPVQPGTPLSDRDCTDLIDTYDGAVAYWDHWCGTLMQELRNRNLFDGTLIAVTSDHGDGFYEHEVWEHANSLYDELLHVPLIIRTPESRPERVPWSVSLSRLPETLVRLAGFEPPPMMSSYGGAILPPPDGHRTCRARAITHGIFEFATVTGDLKWILYLQDEMSTLQCFDLARDPGELHDLAKERQEDEVEGMRNLILAGEEKHRRDALPVQQSPHTEAMEEHLRSLGYLQ